MSLPTQIPINVDIVYKVVKNQADHYFMADEFADYLLEFAKQISKTTQQLASVALVDQGASVAPVPFATGARGSNFRVSYVAQVQQAATINSSLTIKVEYTKNGYSVTESSPAMTSNDPAFPQSGSFVVVADTPTVSYAIDRISNGATPMTYRVNFFIEAIP